jgi:hypothetical protein
MPQDAHGPDAASLAIEAQLRRVRYVRHEFPGRRSNREDSLLALVYDIPYFGACGVFPPFHLLNQLLLEGGSQGGMSPGATWQPFSLSEREYRDLVEAVRTVAPEALRRRARYAHLPYKFDPSLDHHQDYFEWMGVVCAKHREAWHAELRSGGFMA